MAEANPDTSPPESCSTPKDGTDSKEDSSSSPFECNICFDTAKDAVLSKCGHLYCWPCIYRWMDHKPVNPTCPVCKGSISKDTLTPIYGKSGSQNDPRNEAPPRPQGQRQEPPQQNNFFGAPFGNELTFQIGIGAFPFGLFTNFGAYHNPGGHGQNRQQAQHPEAEQERTLAKYFIYIALVFIIWVLY
eukprot:TRINITY_DN6420_c0_g1_i1.p1 TRINITY_DN6420_c0_g1~~TRINITY_DN6420_c0_g1_i1.p1  ORF type:complete len:206 (-),score=29.76 TRINITY_DN6420_c0_g1_i1:219-782(-)